MTGQIDLKSANVVLVSFCGGALIQTLHEKTVKHAFIISMIMFGQS